MNVTLLIKALGYSRDEILDIFYDKDNYTLKRGKLHKTIIAERLKGEVARFDIIGKDGTTIVVKDKKITSKTNF